MSKQVNRFIHGALKAKVTNALQSRYTGMSSVDG